MAATESALKRYEAEPHPEELVKVNRVMQLFKTARDWRRKEGRVAKWQANYHLLQNRQWTTARETWMPTPTASEIYPIIGALVAWMTDQRISTQISPTADPGNPFWEIVAGVSKDLELAIKANFQMNRTPMELEKMLWDALVYGTGFLKTVWDLGAGDGLGDAKIIRVDPFAFYPDPAAHSLDDCNYVIEARTISLQELDRTYPGSAALLRQALASLEDSSAFDQRKSIYSGRYPIANAGGILGNQPVFGLVGQGTRESVGDPYLYDGGVSVYEAWIRDHEVIEEEDRVEDGWHLITVAGNRIIFDKPAIELWGHARHPYTRYVLSDLGEFWGTSLVDHLAPLQRSINRLLASAQQHAELTGNPIFVESKDSGISRTQIVNKPGQRLETNRGSDKPQWLNPPSMGKEVVELVQFYLKEMEKISGLTAITRGQAGGRQPSGTTDATMEASFVRLRDAIRNLEFALMDSGSLLTNLMVEFYTTDRIIAVVGPDGAKTSLALKAFHFYAPTFEKGRMTHVPLRHTLWVDAGSSTPTSRQARVAEMVRFYLLGAVDRQALLEVSEIAGWRDILKRIEQQQKAGTFNPPGGRQRGRGAAQAEGGQQT